jgi:hypothetical protein
MVFSAFCGSVGAAQLHHLHHPALRAERGVSRRELADALGVHYQTVGYLERGE